MRAKRASMNAIADGHGRAHSAASSDASQRQRDGPVRSRPSRRCVTAASPATGCAQPVDVRYTPALVPPARRGRQRPQLPPVEHILVTGLGAILRAAETTAQPLPGYARYCTVRLDWPLARPPWRPPACRHHAVPSGEPSLVSSRSSTRGCAVEFRRVAAGGAGTPRSAAARSAGRPRPGSRRSAPRAPAPGRATRRRPPVPRGLRW